MTPIQNGRAGELEHFQAFLGRCFGIVLHGKTGDWVRFTVVVEDDGNWHVSQGEGSAFWFSDLEEQMKLAREWMDANLVKGQWGYVAP
jgi:hypothetical protein